MSARLGPVRYSSAAGYGFLGVETGLRQDLGPETAALVDEEVRRVVEEAQSRALNLLREHESALHEVARVLQENEMVSGAEIKRIAAAPPVSGSTTPAGA